MFEYRSSSDLNVCTSHQQLKGGKFHPARVHTGDAGIGEKLLKKDKQT
jgi:hypothetical protein